MAELTTQQMIDTIRKGDPLGSNFLDQVAGRLEAPMLDLGTIYPSLEDAEHALLVARSLAELRANAHKGDFAAWTPAPEDLVSEVHHHADKLLAACDAGDLDEVAEHLGDLFNYIRKGWELMEEARREQGGQTDA
jgi:hypothetical protein